MELAGGFPVSLQDTILFYDLPDTMCLANFQLSRWDEANSCTTIRVSERLRLGIKLVAGFGEANSCLKLLDTVWKWADSGANHGSHRDNSGVCRGAGRAGSAALAPATEPRLLQMLVGRSLLRRRDIWSARQRSPAGKHRVVGLGSQKILDSVLNWAYSVSNRKIRA
jgi:hypothetical protein